MSTEPEVLHELIRLRVREQCIAQDLSEAVQIFYSVLLWASRQPESEFRHCALAFIRSKFLQMPQENRLGQMLSGVPYCTEVDSALWLSMCGTDISSSVRAG